MGGLVMTALLPHLTDVHGVSADWIGDHDILASLTAHELAHEHEANGHEGTRLGDCPLCEEAFGKES
jgi:hypothetical protein